MAGYLGYALKAGVEGFKSGFNMAQQKSEMEWQKKKKKELEEKELKIKEGAALYSSLVSQVFADNVASEDEMMKLNTAYLAAGYEVQAVIKDTHNAIQTMDKNKYEQDIAWLELFGDMIEGLDPKDTQGTFDMIKGNVKTEKGLNLFEAQVSLQTKKYEVAQKEKPWEKAAVLPSEMRVPFLEQEGVEIPEPTPTVKEPTFSEKRFNWKIEQYNQGRITLNQLLESEGIDMLPEKATGLEKQIQDIKTEGERAGIDPTEINKAIRDKILGKEAGALTPTPTSTENIRKAIRDSDTVEDARRIYKNYADKYDETALGIDDLDKYWAEGQIIYLNNIKTAIGNIVNEKGWLKKGTLTSAEVGLDFKGEQSVEEIYKMLKEEYTKYRDMLEKMGIDVSQFPKLKPLEEIEKVGFGEGFWGFGKQRGQYKSIYY